MSHTENNQHTNPVSISLRIKGRREYTYRYLGNLKNVLGHVPLGQRPRNRRAHVGHERPAQRPGRLHQHKQHHALVQVRRPALADADALGDVAGKVALEDGVNVGATEADAARVQHAVGAALHQHGAGPRVHLAEIALRPDVPEALVVGGLVLGTGRRGAVVPEVQRRVGEGGGRDEVARGADGDGPAVAAVVDVVVVHGNGDAEGAAHASAAVERVQRVLHYKAARLEQRCQHIGLTQSTRWKRATYNISAAADVGQLRVLVEAYIIEPVKHLLGQHHAGARHNLERRHVGHVARREAVLHELRHPPRADAEQRDLVPGHEPHEHADVGPERAAVVEDGPGAANQRADARHVHDPARRRVLQHHVGRVHAAVQDALLVARDEHGPDAVDDGLWRPRGARRVVHHHGVLEADAHKGGRGDGRGARGEERLPALDAREVGRVVRRGEAGDGNDGLKGAALGDEALQHAGHLVAEVDGVAVVQGAIVEKDKLQQTHSM